MSELALELRHITKRFGTKVVANKDVSMDLRKGEILAILGENGSGKTTLMNMIAGIYYPDEGQILVDGKEVCIASPLDAFNYKIGMIHQHFMLIDVFTAAQNIVLGIKDEKYNLKTINEKVKAIADKYGFNIDPKKKVYDMSVSEKQTVEIIKVLYRGADILILDEPTAVLTPQETQKLFAVLRNMKKDGKSIIIITHKMHEVLSISDRVVVLRKGEYIGTRETSGSTESSLTEMMVGKKVSLDIDRSLPENTEDKILFENVSCVNVDGRNVLDNVSFTAKSGEILGIAGIAGSGQKELLESIAGLQKINEGKISFIEDNVSENITMLSHKEIKNLILNKQIVLCDDFEKKVDLVSFLSSKQYQQAQEEGFAIADSQDKKEKLLNLLNIKQIKQLAKEGKIVYTTKTTKVDLLKLNPKQIKKLGISLAFVPEDRLGMGLVANMDLIDNVMLRSYTEGRPGFLNRKDPKILTDKIIDDLEVVTPSDRTQVRNLSGGNVQKILVGREIALAPKVLLAAYPVRGLDINSSYLIYNLLNDQKKKGVSVIFVGEDLDVILGLCDRIMVINDGKAIGIVDGRTATKEQIGRMMTMTEPINNDIKE